MSLASALHVVCGPDDSIPRPTIQPGDRLSAYAYPGHEALREAMAALVARLASRHLPESRVEDPSREVFWNEWIEDGGVRRLMLLNTDWTSAGNRKTVRIDAGGVVFETAVVEREAKILTIVPGMVLEPDSSDLHLEVAADGSIRCHGTGRHRVVVHRPGGADSSLPFDAEAFASSVGILAPPPP